MGTEQSGLCISGQCSESKPESRVRAMECDSLGQSFRSQNTTIKPVFYNKTFQKKFRPSALTVYRAK